MRIGELAERVNLSVRTIRYYEEIGLLSPPDRTGAGYRTFSESHVVRLRFIRRAQSIGMKLDQIRRVLDFQSTDVSPCQCVRESVQQNIKEIDERIASLQAMRSNLEHALSQLDNSGIRHRDALICPAIESVKPDPSRTTLDSPVDWRV